MIAKQRIQIFRISALIAFLMIFYSFAALASVAAAQPSAGELDNATHASAEDHGSSGHETGVNWFTKNIDPDKNIREQRPPLGYMFINFSLVLILVYFLARKPISRMLVKRRDNITAALNEAEALKKEADLAIESARARMAAMDAEVESLRRAIMEAGAHQAKRIEEETVLRAARLREDTRAIVAHEINRLSVELRAEVVEEIVSLATKLITEKITGADHARLADQYIATLGESSHNEAESR